MHHKIYEENGDTIQEFDLEAIEYFIEGLEELKKAAPGETFSTPSYWQEDDGTMMMADFILKRVEEKDDGEQVPDQEN